MPSSTVEQHLAAAVEYLAIAESGDAERSAYEHAAIEIEAAMQDDSTLTQAEVARRVGKSKDYVGRLLASLSRARDTGTFEMDWKNYGRNRDVGGAVRIAREQPDTFVEAFRQAPPEARQAIAREISHAPEVRTEARQRDFEAEQSRRPSPVKPRSDLTMYQFESKLAAMYGAGKQALALLHEVDQPGDDEDILDQLGRIKQLAEIIEEAYRTGKSLDTWAAELYEERAE